MHHSACCVRQSVYCVALAPHALGWKGNMLHQVATCAGHVGSLTCCGMAPLWRADQSEELQVMCIPSSVRPPVLG